MISSISTNHYGLSQSFDRLSHVSANIANDKNLQNIEKNIVELVDVHHEVKAQAISLDTADSVMGTLIDLKI